MFSDKQVIRGIAGAIVCMAVVCGGCKESGSDREGKAERRVIRWVNRIPYADRFSQRRYLGLNDKAYDYEKWVNDGRKIEGAVEVLNRLLLTKDSRVEIAQVAWLLGSFGDKDSVPALLCALEYENANVRMEAAHALGRIKDESAVAALGKRIINDIDANVRLNAVQALGEIGHVSGKPFLEIAAQDDWPEVSEMAEEYLEEFAEDKPVNPKNGL